MNKRRKYLRPRQRPERAVKVRRYDPDQAIENLKHRLRFLSLGFEYWTSEDAPGTDRERA